MGGNPPPCMETVARIGKSGIELQGRQQVWGYPFNLMEKFRGSKPRSLRKSARKRISI